MSAGGFGRWRQEMNSALAGQGESNVPCGSCTACCVSSQFIHIEPDEVETLERIPRQLLFSAPGLRKGHRLLGYDTNGHCPMFVEGRCSIYEHRPRTCRTYDCRLFVAAGVESQIDKPLVKEHVARWQFEFEDDRERAEFEALKAAAAFLTKHRAELPRLSMAPSATEVAVLALQLYELFILRDTRRGTCELAQPKLEAVRAELEQLARTKREG